MPYQIPSSTLVAKQQIRKMKKFQKYENRKAIILIFQGISSYLIQKHFEGVEIGGYLYTIHQSDTSSRLLIRLNMLLIQVVQFYMYYHHPTKIAAIEFCIYLYELASIVATGCIYLFILNIYDFHKGKLRKENLIF